jgi:serine/threonine protein kinase
MIILLLQVKCYMQQLLCGLEHCHSRHILHRDIKGSNLLIDNRGILKIADFGLASFFDPEQRHPLTSRVVTLWYRPPELLLGATNYGVAVDLWSSGCILAELYAGKPIMPGRTEVEQLHKIFKLCGSPSEDYWRKSKLPHATIFKPQHPYARRVSETFKDFPPPAVALVDVLLSVDPADRGTASSALQSEFFATKPYACNPSSLPRYPPSKEFDAKRREEEARRYLRQTLCLQYYILSLNHKTSLENLDQCSADLCIPSWLHNNKENTLLQIRVLKSINRCIMNLTLSPILYLAGRVHMVSADQIYNMIGPIPVLVFCIPLWNLSPPSHLPYFYVFPCVINIFYT